MGDLFSTIQTCVFYR